VSRGYTHGGKTLALDAFNVGDKVVYPGHGVGRIESVICKSIAGTEQTFFNITIVDTGMKILVPLPQAKAVGLRRVIDKKSIEKVYAILQDRKAKKIDTQTWNRRFREYNQKIKTGSPFEIAEVLRDLCILSADKELSFGEKKMFETAQNLLVSEIAVAKSKTQEKVMSEIQSLFA